MHPSSHDKIINEFLKEYIESHALTLLRMDNSGLIQMLQEDKFHDIKLMYSLFRRCPGALNVLKQELKGYIVAEGQKYVRNESISNDELVKRIIEFRERMVELLNKSLEKDSTVELTIKNSFESFINENEKTAKSLVMYLDDQFKKDFKNNTEVEISGSGTVHASPTGSLEVAIAGSGDVVLYSEPSSVETAVVGSGDIRRASKG